MQYKKQKRRDYVNIEVERDGKLQAVCFSDLNYDERKEWLKDTNVAYLKRLCCSLADALYKLEEIQ